MDAKYLFAAVAALILTACAASITEVVPAGKDTFVVVGEDTFEVDSGASIKTTLYKKANEHCETMGKKLLPLNESVSSYGAELRFRCLEEDDPDYVRPIMESVPGEGWKSIMNWRKLTTGMSTSDVQKILGEPHRVDGGSFTSWYYQNDGEVIFIEGKVYQWKEPRSSGDRILNSKTSGTLGNTTF